RGEVNNDPIHYNIDQGNVLDEVGKALKDIIEARKVDAKEAIDIFGWSRGAMAAIALAKTLEESGTEVRFLGLIDPTAPLKKYTADEGLLKIDLNKLGPNVKNAAIIYRDGKNDGNWVKHEFYKALVVVTVPTFSDKTKVLVNKAVPLDHLSTGFNKDVA